MDIYAAAGVDYDVLDAGKRSALAAALSTQLFSHVRGAVGLEESRGEPAFVFKLDDRYMAMVLECLGTKSLIARQFQDETGINRFDAIGYDSVAAIVNDIICVGALPLVINAYFATGSPDWYKTNDRFEALVKGWTNACSDSKATWGGGESPGLSGIVAESEIDLAGCAIGATPRETAPIFGSELKPGNQIVLVASSGLHTNGASLIRKLVNELENGYSTQLPSGRLFGEAVLDPSVIYVDLIEELLKTNIPLTYLSHITGHGFRKLMRANREVTYRITKTLDVPEVLKFVIDKLQMSASDAYGTFNMGAGFAVFCENGHGDNIVSIAESRGYKASVAGVVEQGQRKVLIEPLNLTYTEEDLQLR